MSVLLDNIAQWPNLDLVLWVLSLLWLICIHSSRLAISQNFLLNSSNYFYSCTIMSENWHIFDLSYLQAQSVTKVVNKHVCDGKNDRIYGFKNAWIGLLLEMDLHFPSTFCSANVNVFHTLKALLVWEEVSHNNPPYLTRNDPRCSCPICLFFLLRFQARCVLWSLQIKAICKDSIFFWEWNRFPLLLWY